MMISDRILDILYERPILMIRIKTLKVDCNAWGIGI